jgi:hypothetical protein
MKLRKNKLRMSYCAVENAGCKACMIQKSNKNVTDSLMGPNE